MERVPTSYDGSGHEVQLLRTLADFRRAGVIVFWVLFQVVALDASVGRAIASPINLFALMSVGFLTIGYTQKRRRRV